MSRIALSAALMAACCLPGCHTTNAKPRPGVEVRESIRDADLDSIDLLEDFPEPGTYDEMADVSFESTGLDKLSRAEHGMRIEAARVGADAVVVQDLRVIRSIGATTNMYGVAIRRH